MKPMPKPKQVDQNLMLILANDRLKIERVCNLLEHEIINILGNGDPKVSAQDFLRLNRLGYEISALKKELKAKTLKSEMIKKAYFKALSRKHGCRIRLK